MVVVKKSGCRGEKSVVVVLKKKRCCKKKALLLLLLQKRVVVVRKSVVVFSESRCFFPQKGVSVVVKKSVFVCCKE